MNTDQSRSPSLQESFWPCDESVPLVDFTVGALLAERARTHADAPALAGVAHGTDEWCRLSYRELYAEAQRVAAGLLRLAKPGEHVAIWAPNIVEWPIIEYGAALAGMTLVALNPVLRAGELRYVLNHSRASVLLHADQSRNLDLAAIVAQVRPECPELREVVSLSERERWMADPVGLPDLSLIEPDSIAMLQYTSGTTGLPKGVLLRHRSLVNVARLTMEVAEVEREPVAVAPLPMFHTAGCVISTLGPLWLGGCMVLVEQFQPEPVLELIRRERASVLFYVPTVLGALLEVARTSPEPAPRLRTIMGGAAIVPGAMIEGAQQLFGARVHNLFGQTELAPVLTLTRRSDLHADLVNTVGRPLPQVECKIVDPATDRVQPLGVQGEVCARGYQQMVEYLDDPAATARVIDPEGWMHTEDLGMMDERGYVTLTGRLKDIVIRGGENIAPAEIESCLTEHEAVLEAAVVGVPDERWGEIVVAIVRIGGEAPAGLLTALIEHCKERLSSFKVPVQWFVADELPRNALGKVQKFKLREAIAGGQLRKLEETDKVSGIAVRREHLAHRFPAWTPRTLDAFLDYCVEHFAERPFVITDDRTMSYAETARRSAQLADGLAALGVRRGDRVGMLVANYLEFAPVKFAISHAGAVAIPFNYLYRQQELGYVLRQSRCNVLVTMTGFAGLDYLGMLDSIAPGWESGSTDVLPDLHTVVLLSTDGRARTGVRTVADLAALGAEHPGAADGFQARPDDLGDILYTSGTTGSPKGVMVTHDAVLRTAYASALTRAFQDGRRILFSLPCYHMFGYVEGLLAAMFVGGAIIPRTTFSPANYFAGIERHRATEILCVPTMTVALLEHPDRQTRDLSSLTAILSGAAPAPVWVWQKVQSELGVTEITTGYGMTECGGAMTMSLPEDPLECHSETVGRVKFAGVAGLPDHGGDLCYYKTVDPLTGEDLPDGVEGELVSHGPTHMLGFWEKPQETAATLRGGWVHSGDLGQIRDGYLQITGRSKELYKSGGELVMPKEIEELLTRHSGISQAYLVGVPDERWGEAGCAWIVREPGAEITAEDVIKLCKEKLAQFKVPKYVLFIEATDLPTTPTGKVQKFRLVQQAKQRLERKDA